MLSINTNLSSLIAQNSMSSATKLLNQAIERMTTGYKINHAKDNAANYSISQKMNMQISSYDVAADNVAMGMDLVTTASDIISNMQDKASRLQALCTQARNGTYGAQSMQAINTEAGAIMAEINRLYNTAEYNNVSLFNRKAYELTPEHQALTEQLKSNGPTAKAEYNGFIEDPKTYTDEEVAAMTRVKDVSTFTSGQKYAIYSKEELQKLADYVNAGNDTTGVEFVLGADIDLSSISNWTPIGDYSTNSSYKFKGTFDGNGHVIKNLTINNPTENNQGLFGYIDGSEIKNIALENVNINASLYVGGLVGYIDASNSIITNCYSTGTVIGQDIVGGLAGFSSNITDCYSTCSVSGNELVGGLVGASQTSSSLASINNCYATGIVQGNNYVGGLIGIASCLGTLTIDNCYAQGSVSGKDCIGGLVGKISPCNSVSVTNSYAKGSVQGDNFVGGLCGSVYTDTLRSDLSVSISNSFATGSVSGKENIGGLIGRFGAALLQPSPSGPTPPSPSGPTPPLEPSREFSISNCYAAGDINGTNFVGGLVGQIKVLGTIAYDNNYAYGSVQGADLTSSGGLIGGLVNTPDETDFTSVEITNCQANIQNNIKSIGGCFDNDENIINYDMTTMLAGISAVEFKNISTTLQVGINSDLSNQISFDTNFSLNIGSLGDLSSNSTLASITEIQNLLSDKATALGAVENRLQSAIESIEVNIENLTSSLSTIRDADIAEVSSEYIRQQILQQASATLLATANQSPSIALQLI